MERPADGQSSIYYDASEHSHLIDDGTSQQQQYDEQDRQRARLPNLPEQESPWVSEQQSPLPSAGTSTILPSAAHGYLSMGMAMTTSGGTPSVPLSETETFTTTLPDDESTIMDSSYAAHLRAQSSMPKRWLNEVDIDPYLRMPGASRISRGRKEGPSSAGASMGVGGFLPSPLFPSSAGGARRSYLREPLLEELLPSSRKQTLFPALHGPVSRRDRPVATVFWCAFALLMLIGSLLCFVYPAELRDQLIRSTSMLHALVDSAWLLATSIAIATAVSLLWVALMRLFTREIIRLMIFLLPIASSLAGLWALLEFIHADAGGGFWLLVASIGSFCTALFFTYFIRKHQDALQSTIAVSSMAAQVLSENLGIYVISFILLAVYLLFVAIWILFFAHILMLGYVERIPADHLIRQWRLSGLSYALQAYFLFMLLWISNIFSYIQKCTIGGIVGRWYFFRSEVEAVPGNANSVGDCLRAAVTTFFGQICLAALLISMVRVTRSIIRAFRFVAERVEAGFLHSLLRGMNLCFGFLERLVEHVTDLAISYIALTGEEFWTASRSVFKIFRRNMLVGFTADLIAQLLFLLAMGTAAGLAGLLGYVFVAHVLESRYGLMTGLLFGMLTWFVMRFFISILSDTIDASFICFAIDLDTQKLHNAPIHQAFSHRVATGREP